MSKVGSTKKLGFSKGFLKDLDHRTKELLDDCGEVRDIDVALENLNFQTLKNAKWRLVFQKKQRLAVRSLQCNWPRGKCKGLELALERFLTHRLAVKVLDKQFLGQQLVFLFNKKLKSRPRSKKQWHKFRRHLRRANYLMALLDRKAHFTSKFQKLLGQLHDLETLNKLADTKVVTIEQVSHLRRKAKTYYAKLATNSGW
jgi:CHAD domain-containing protein